MAPAPGTIQRLLIDAATDIEAQQDLSYSSPKLEARLLLEYVLNKNHAWLIAHADKPITEAELSKFKHLLGERLRGKPIAYILGTQGFWNLQLKVSECTLIPRQDTESLIETVLDLSLPDNTRVLDLGTGTGAIALALAQEHPKWQVTGVDRIAEAVALAKDNARLNQLCVDFRQSDWFSVFDDSHHASFDLIVSNPPYVAPDSEYLQQGDLRFEPLSALVAADEGFADIRHIIEHAKRFLRASGFLVFEHGHEQSETIQTLLCEAGFTEVKSHLDYNDLPRVTLGRYT